MVSTNELINKGRHLTVAIWRARDLTTAAGCRNASQGRRRVHGGRSGERRRASETEQPAVLHGDSTVLASEAPQMSSRAG
jgi:hypothetical protein